mgnify:CR=1 FL=1
MPPKTQFTKAHIIEAAFSIACESGFKGITARNVSKRLGSSVAPIYVNFETIESLHEAVMEYIKRTAAQLLEAQEGESLYERVGRSSIAFAKKYPMLIQDLVSNPQPEGSMHDELAAYLAEDPTMKGLTYEQRRRLLIKMQIFQTGLTVMIASGNLRDQAEELLMETGEDLRQAEQRRQTHKEGQDYGEKHSYHRRRHCRLECGHMGQDQRIQLHHH